MFFRRNAGKYRETDRVTRFKLIKSGKNWLRAATANFGLFKVVKGSADAPSVSAQSVEEKTPVLSGQALLKGIAAAGALAGGAVTTYTAQAEEMTSPALERQLTANQDVTANSDSVVLSTASVSEASVVASTSQESTVLQLTPKQAQMHLYHYHNQCHNLYPNRYQLNCHKLSQNQHL